MGPKRLAVFPGGALVPGHDRKHSAVTGSAEARERSRRRYCLRRIENFRDQEHQSEISHVSKSVRQITLARAEDLQHENDVDDEKPETKHQRNLLPPVSPNQKAS